MKKTCDICFKQAQVRCKCKYYDRDGEHPSTICRECFIEHICLTWWMRLKIWWATKKQLKCPFDMIEFKKIPGYVSGYGCPVCKSIRPWHITLRKN